MRALATPILLLALTTTANATPTPTLYSSNPDCASLGYDDGYKPSFTSGSSTFTFDGNQSLTLDWDKHAADLEWSSSCDIQAVIVKGGSDSNVYEYDPASTGDSGLMTPVNSKNGKNYGLSHVEVCFSTCDDPDPVCGDGTVDAGEECDDGNTTNGDGCDATCENEPFCGDGHVDPGEECDDGNTTSGDGCDATCNDEGVCGDGHVDPGEECDDGNTTNGDGCDAYCENEPFCGDGHVDPGEECDDGNTTSGDGCDATCNDEGVCGDGHVDSGEECDDGNTTSGDGCDATCNDEGVCGDGHVDAGEECDDGNTTNGDGCDSTCMDENACDPYIQFNGCPLSLHPYGSGDAVAQYGNTGTGTCNDVTVYCYYDDVLDSTATAPYPFSQVDTGTSGSTETLDFTDSGSGVDVIPGQNYNICIPMSVDSDGGTLTCEILIDGFTEDVATCDVDVIPC